MILGIGIDLVEIVRLERALARWGERLARRLFTSRERETCESRARAGQCFATRLAAKEAFLKALGTGLARGIRWQDMELLRPEGQPPSLGVTGKALEILQQRGGTRVWVSISHEGGFSVAVVVIEGQG